MEIGITDMSNFQPQDGTQCQDPYPESLQVKSTPQPWGLIFIWQFIICSNSMHMQINWKKPLFFGISSFVSLG